jgi:hypothetical protein
LVALKWFPIIERQATQGGTCRSGADLNAKIRAFIPGIERPIPPHSLGPGDHTPNEGNQQGEARTSASRTTHAV